MSIKMKVGLASVISDGYEAMNDVQDARMAYARSVELNPGNEHAKSELVKLRKWLSPCKLSRL